MLTPPPVTGHRRVRPSEATRVIGLVLVVSLLIRCIYLWSLPLVITNEGQAYLHWALEILHGRP